MPWALSPPDWTAIFVTAALWGCLAENQWKSRTKMQSSYRNNWTWCMNMWRECLYHADVCGWLAAQPTQQLDTDRFVFLFKIQNFPPLFVLLYSSGSASGDQIMFTSTTLVQATRNCDSCAYSRKLFVAVTCLLFLVHNFKFQSIGFEEDNACLTPLLVTSDLEICLFLPSK